MPKEKAHSGASSRPAARRPRRTSAEIHDRLIDAAGEEFEANGYAGATTAAIARRAEVTEAQLFRCFPSKAELFRAAIFEPLNRHFAAFQARMQADEGAPYRKGAETYIAELEDFIAGHSRMLMSLVVAQSYDPGMRARGETIDGLEAYFERGAAMMRSRLAGEARVPPELMVRVSFAAVLGCLLFSDWLFPAGLADDQAIRRAISDFVIDGTNANNHAARNLPENQAS
ncbi:MAG: TetR/AcrR family transcriptional regulator [Novosphingobium sp.]|nr:TetR/AcrR family transcriptional regulator [Novosphingobium sp.]